MEDTDFKELFQGIVDRYELDPDIAADLLQRILKILEKMEPNNLQFDPKCEILTEHKEGEDDPCVNLRKK